jgi:hypothetical protein
MIGLLPSNDDILASSTKQILLEKLQSYTFYTIHRSNENEMRCCVTAVNKNLLVTFAHSPHDQISLNSVITIYSVLGDAPFQVKVVKVDSKKDFILLKSDADVCMKGPALGTPYQGEDYIQLGLSATTQETTPYSVSKGVVASAHSNANGHFLGSAGSNPGGSGGGCFSALTYKLLGINVGCESVPIHGNTTLLELGTRYPARAHIVPSLFFIE